MPTRKIHLDKKRFAAFDYITPEMVDNMEAELSDLAFGTAIRVATFLGAERIGDEERSVIHYFDVPATRFEMLKQAILPQWLQRKWPIKTRAISQSTTVRFTAYHLYRDHPPVREWDPLQFIEVQYEDGEDSNATG